MTVLHLVLFPHDLPLCLLSEYHIFLIREYLTLNPLSHVWVVVIIYCVIVCTAECPWVLHFWILVEAIQNIVTRIPVRWRHSSYDIHWILLILTEDTTRLDFMRSFHHILFTTLSYLLPQMNKAFWILFLFKNFACFERSPLLRLLVQLS